MSDSLPATQPHHPAGDPDATAGGHATHAPPEPHSQPSVSGASDRTSTRPPDQPTTVFPVLAPSAVMVPGYEVVREAARGGMGVVYEARQAALNRTVALKMVLGEGRADDRALGRFMVEAEAVAAVRHPNVVQVHDCGQHQGRPFIVLEFCPGGTLADRLRTTTRLAPHDAAEVALKVARGVAAAHARGIVHRDLKPSNVLFDEGGEPKVADFGLAKLSAGSELTRVGDVVGTPAYMAPEQAGGKPREVGPPADVWAVGVVLYECLTGERPFEGGSAAEVMNAVQWADVIPPRRRGVSVPRDLEFICLKCLRKNPADRYPSAAELADELRRYLAGEPLGARSREWRYRARTAVARWWRPAVTAAAVLFGGAGVWVAAKSANAPSHEAPAPEDPGARLRREEVLRRVDAHTRGKPNPDRDTPHPITHVGELPPTDAAAYRVIYDDRLVDLRGWRDLSADPDAESNVVFHNRRVMTKITPVDTYRIEYRTSGRDLFLRAVSPSPEKAAVFAADRPGYVGRQPMKIRQLQLDTSAIPVDSEFTVQTVATYRDSLQTPDDRWLGVMGYEGSLKASILLIFPDDRPFRDYTLRVARTKQSEPADYTGERIAFAAENHRWLYWEIPYPGDGCVYRVDWTW